MALVEDDTEAEAARLEVLETYPLDRPGLSTQLDRLAGVAASICEAPIGLASIVRAKDQIFVGKSGLEVEGTPRDVSFCDHAMRQSEIMIVPDARQDPRFSQNPLVTGDMAVRFYAGVPLISPEGFPLGSFCVIDNEPRSGLSPSQLEALHGLADAALAVIESARSEARASVVRARSRRALQERDERFQLLADSMPQLMWSTRADGMTDYFNRGWIEFTGQPAERSFGAGWLDFVHPDDKPMADVAWTRAVETRKTYEVEYRLRNATGEYRWVLARGVPMLDAQGDVQRWFGSCTDIHESKRNSEQLQILSRELNHRIKNIFAVIGGLVSMTMRHRPEVREAGTELQDRILALGRAHDHVRADSTNYAGDPSQSSLMAMLRVILAPYQDNAGERIRISGQDIAVDDRSATPLALFVHELATNAAKYGALSSEDGQVDIWLSHGEDALISWKESGGPAVSPAPSDGFGASLVQMSIARQLGGTVDYDWHRAGLEVTARIPLAAMKR